MTDLKKEAMGLGDRVRANITACVRAGSMSWEEAERVHTDALLLAYAARSCARSAEDAQGRGDGEFAKRKIAKAEELLAEVRGCDVWTSRLASAAV